MKKYKISQKGSLLFAILMLMIPIGSATVAFSGTTCVSPYAIEPLAEDIYMLELINRARANPDAEALRYNIDLNEGVPSSKTITNEAKQPLAFNIKLYQAALQHSTHMLENNYFDHDTNSDPKQGTPQTRAIENGYDYLSNENLAIHFYSGPLEINQEMADNHHEGLFVDEKIQGRGHRVNMLITSNVEAGIAFDHGENFFYNSTNWASAVVSTTDFGRGEHPSFICGVIYDDKNSNEFYDVGEGLPYATISILETGESVQGYSAGAYSLPTSSQGTFTVEAQLCESGARAEKIVTMGSDNVKVDFLWSDFEDRCASLIPNEHVFPQTEKELEESPVQIEVPTMFFIETNDLEITVDFPCFESAVDIYLAFFTINQQFIFVQGDGSLTTEWLPIVINATNKYQSTVVFDDALINNLGVCWLIVPTNDLMSENFQLGYVDATRLW